MMEWRPSASKKPKTVRFQIDDVDPIDLGVHLNANGDPMIDLSNSGDELPDQQLDTQDPPNIVCDRNPCPNQDPEHWLLHIHDETSSAVQRVFDGDHGGQSNVDLENVAASSGGAASDVEEGRRSDDESNRIDMAHRDGNRPDDIVGALAQSENHENEDHHSNDDDVLSDGINADTNRLIGVAGDHGQDNEDIGRTEATETVVNDTNERITRKYLQLTWPNLEKVLSDLHIDAAPFRDHCQLFIYIMHQIFEEKFSVNLGIYGTYEYGHDGGWHSHAHLQSVPALKCRNYTQFHVHRDTIIEKYNLYTQQWRDQQSRNGPLMNQHLDTIPWDDYPDDIDLDNRVLAQHYRPNDYLCCQVQSSESASFLHSWQNWPGYISKEREDLPIAGWDKSKYGVINIPTSDLETWIQKYRANPLFSRPRVDNPDSNDNGGRGDGDNDDGGDDDGGDDEKKAPGRKPTASDLVSLICWDDPEHAWPRIADDPLLRGFLVHHQSNIIECIRRAGLRERERERRRRAMARGNIPSIDVNVDWSNWMQTGPDTVDWERALTTILAFLKNTLQDGIFSKFNLLYLELPMVNSGKTTFLELLIRAGYSNYELVKQDGRWLGQDFRGSESFISIDSLIPSHFDTQNDGLPLSKFEQIAGGRPCALPKRGASPMNTGKQPFIVTTQRKLTDFAVFQSETGRDMFSARAVYQYFPHGETLFPLIDYLADLWNIESIYDQPQRTAADLGYSNRLPPYLRGNYCNNQQPQNHNT